MERSLHTLPQLNYSFDLCWLLIKFPFHKCPHMLHWIQVRGLRRSSKYIKFCIDNHYLTKFCSMLRIIIMLKYDTRNVETTSFNCFHDPILKNVNIQSFCHLPLYLAHVTHAMGSHTNPTQQFIHFTCAYAHDATWLQHLTSSLLVMLSQAKKTFKSIKENILRDHTTKHK